MKKTTSENLSKRLKQYGSLSIAIAGVSAVNAQAGYSGVVDIFVQKDGQISAQIDFNGDMVYELEFTQLSSSARVWANSNASNFVEVLGTTGPAYPYPLVLDLSNPINSSQTNWQSGTWQVLNYHDSSNSSRDGNWIDKTSKYLGLRFTINSEIHFGWLRLTVPNNANDGITIHDYYFNPNADQPVLAGQFAPLSVNEDIFSKVKIVASQKRISLYNLNESTNFRLYSLSGQAVLEGKTNQNTYVIEVETIASGIYVIELMDADSKGIMRKKILL